MMILLVAAFHFLLMLVLSNFVHVDWSDLYDGWIRGHDESLALALALLSLATSYALLRHRIRREPVERAP